MMHDIQPDVTRYCPCDKKKSLSSIPVGHIYPRQHSKGLGSTAEYQPQYRPCLSANRSQLSAIDPE